MESFVDAWNGLWVPCEERRTALWTAVVVAIGKLRPLREILADWKIARFEGIVLRKLVGALTTRPGKTDFRPIQVSPSSTYLLGHCIKRIKRMVAGCL